MKRFALAVMVVALVAIAFIGKIMVGGRVAPQAQIVNNADHDYMIATFSVPDPLLDVLNGADMLTFRSPRDQENRQPQMVKELFAVKGVSFVEVLPYEIRVAKSGAYDWGWLVKPIESVIHKHLDHVEDDVKTAHLNINNLNVMGIELSGGKMRIFLSNGKVLSFMTNQNGLGVLPPPITTSVSRGSIPSGLAETNRCLHRFSEVLGDRVNH